MMERSFGLILLSLALFVVSFFLPAYQETYFNGLGWECAQVCLEMLKPGSDEFNNPDRWYFGSFNLSNLAMSIMPILLLTVFRERGVPLSIVIVQGILILHVISWPVRVWLSDSNGHILWGYYVWLISMIVIFTISICREPKSGKEKDHI